MPLRPAIWPRRRERMSKATGKGGPLRIAVASGKGRTGKTTLAVALALTAPAPALLLDCDVEETDRNCHLDGILFFKFVRV